MHGTTISGYSLVEFSAPPRFDVQTVTLNGLLNKLKLLRKKCQKTTDTKTLITLRSGVVFVL